MSAVVSIRDGGVVQGTVRKHVLKGCAATRKPDGGHGCVCYFSTKMWNMLLQHNDLLKRAQRPLEACTRRYAFRDTNVADKLCLKGQSEIDSRYTMSLLNSLSLRYSGPGSVSKWRFF